MKTGERNNGMKRRSTKRIHKLIKLSPKINKTNRSRGKLNQKLFKASKNPVQRRKIEVLTITMKQRHTKTKYGEPRILTNSSTLMGNFNSGRTKN